jgi:hypothetical protein
MDELQTLLIEQFRFVQSPNAEQWRRVEQAMYAYQTKRYGELSVVKKPG